MSRSKPAARRRRSFSARYSAVQKPTISSSQRRARAPRGWRAKSGKMRVPWARTGSGSRTTSQADPRRVKSRAKRRSSALSYRRGGLEGGSGAEGSSVNTPSSSRTTQRARRRKRRLQSRIGISSAR
jgi:hypothetical protein